MKTQILLLTLSAVIIFSGCKTSEYSPLLEGVKHEVIKFSDLKHKGFEYLPDRITNKIKYVVFDDSDENYLFGDNIKSIRIIDGQIYLLYWMQWDNQGLLVFDMDGKGVKKLDKRGRGPGEYIQISDFDVDADGNTWVVDGNQDKLYVYDKDFEFVHSTASPFDIDEIQCLPDNKLMFALTSWNTIGYEGKQLLLSDDKLNVIDTYLEHDKSINISFSRSALTKSGEFLSYNFPIDDNIYVFGLDGKPLKTYTFDFGNRKVPETLRDNSNISDVDSHTNYMNELENYRFLSGFVYNTDNYIVGRLYDLSGQQRHYITDLSAKTIYLSEDKLHYKFQILGGYENTIIAQLKFTEEDRSTYPPMPDDIFEQLKEGKPVFMIYKFE